MVAVNQKAPAPATTVVDFNDENNHQFTIVIDGVETAIHDGFLRCNGGGTVTVVSPGVLAVDRVHHVVVRGGVDVSFTRCGFAAAESCGGASFHRCDAVRADGAREVSVRRCRSADVERVAGAVSIRRRCGAVRVERCLDATVSGCGTVAVRRGKVNVIGQPPPVCYEDEKPMYYRHAEPDDSDAAAIVRDGRHDGTTPLAGEEGCRVRDWCGALGIGRCGSADVSRCGAVRVERCLDATVSGCGTVAVRRGKVNVIEQPPVCYGEEKPMYYHHAEPVCAMPLEIMNK
uniref:Right handed beta helix domain-containing protein n=1 Tax=Leersia perrieri TaxID=77586 RepID=A0A0D9XRC6_9ORYZ